MSNAQYEFISTDADSIVKWMTDKYEEITGVTVQPGSPERLFIQWAAAVVLQERVQANYAAKQNIPSQAEGENLDALAELFYAKQRPGATAASCTMRFYISQAQEFAVLIPAGTRVTDASSTLIWTTTEDVYVDQGETYADVLVRCQTTGAVGNGFIAGQINTIVDLFAYYLRCENISQSDGGSDAATDREFYELLRLSMDALSTAGAQGSYIYHAKSVSTQIADVAAVSPTPGVVKLYALMNDGTIAGKEIKDAILAACNADDVRPLTDQVFVEDAETVDYDIDLTYYLQNGISRSAAEIDEQVKAAVKEFAVWQCGKLGRDINPSRLYQMLMGAGVKRVELRSPEFRALKSGTDKSVPQLAKLGKTTIASGGYEDE